VCVPRCESAPLPPWLIYVSRNQLAAVHLCDAHYVTDASKYISVLLLSLRTMLHLELPHINVLSKVDLITQYGELGKITSFFSCYAVSHSCSYISVEKKDFNLDFYTEVKDLSYLENTLAASLPPKFAKLNMALISLIEDYSLVGFETLAVEDKHSMLLLARTIDRATGYVFVPPPNATQPPGTTTATTNTNTNTTDDDPSSNPGAAHRPNEYGLFSSVLSTMRGPRSDVRDVQERWVDAREEWDAFERKEWRKEGEMSREIAASQTGETNQALDNLMAVST
jgi:hypothetical protein